MEAQLSLTPTEFNDLVVVIKNKRKTDQSLTLFETFVESCFQYNGAMQNNSFNDAHYFEGKKTAYLNLINSGMDPHFLIVDWMEK